MHTRVMPCPLASAAGDACAGACAFFSRAQHALGASGAFNGNADRLVVSLVHRIHRDRSHGPHKAAHNQTEAEARLLHASVRWHDPSARFLWLVHEAELAELRSWTLPRLTLLPVREADLDAWVDCIAAPRTRHHSGPALGYLKLLLPLLVPAPALIADTDTVALAGVRRLWPTAAATSEEQARWVLAHGTEQGHINGGLLAWAAPPEPRGWLCCVHAGAAWLQANASRTSVTSATSLKYAEQAFFVHVCDAARQPHWRQSTGCALACQPHSPADYATGCSPPGRAGTAWKPEAAFHYNCQPRGSRERALALLARSGYPGARRRRL